MQKNNYYLGKIRYRTNVKWNEIDKLIEANDIQEAEKKLHSWGLENVGTKDFLIIVTETL